MKTLIERVLRVWWMTALCVVLVACKTTYVPVETVRIEEREKLKIERDSIHVHDSVYIYLQGDTVYEERWKTIYKEVFRTDTFLITKTVNKTVLISTIVDSGQIYNYFSKSIRLFKFLLL